VIKDHGDPQELEQTTLDPPILDAKLGAGGVAIGPYRTGCSARIVRLGRSGDADCCALRCFTLPIRVPVADEYRVDLCSGYSFHQLRHHRITKIGQQPESVVLNQMAAARLSRIRPGTAAAQHRQPHSTDPSGRAATRQTARSVTHLGARLTLADPPICMAIGICLMEGARSKYHRTCHFRRIVLRTPGQPYGAVVRQVRLGSVCRLLVNHSACSPLGPGACHA